jgi:hypothetical protein
MTSEPVLYKATVHMRWRNRLSGVWNDVFGGQVMEFDEGDFATAEQLATDQREPFLTMTSLEDVLASGAFVVFDPATARDVDAMSRDEMIEILAAAGRADGLSPQHPMEELRPMVTTLFASEDAAAAVEDDS